MDFPDVDYPETRIALSRSTRELTDLVFDAYDSFKDDSPRTVVVLSSETARNLAHEILRMIGDE